MSGFYFVDPAARFKRVVASAPAPVADFIPASNGYELEAYRRYETERIVEKVLRRAPRATSDLDVWLRQHNPLYAALADSLGASNAYWYFGHGAEAELVHVLSRRPHSATNPFSVRATRDGLFIWCRPDQLFATRVVQGKQVYFRDLISREQLDALPVW